MARNEEKAQAMLNRWWKMKRQLTTKPLENRPMLSNECNSINECEKWREQIIREVSKKVTNIQNAGLGEHRIRDLNDEINKLLREKAHWEDRIRELGGLDYRKLNAKLVDSQGAELPGSGGYKYFGAAKDLPGVRELFQKEMPNAPNKYKGDLYKNINYNYYGFLQNEDKEMLEEELKCENEKREEEVKKWIENNQKIIKKKFKGRNIAEIALSEILKLIDEDEVINLNSGMDIEKEDFPLDYLKEMELEKKKKALLEKYVGIDNEKPIEDTEEKLIKELIIMNEDA